MTEQTNNTKLNAHEILDRIKERRANMTPEELAEERRIEEESIEMERAYAEKNGYDRDYDPDAKQDDPEDEEFDCETQSEIDIDNFHAHNSHCPHQVTALYHAYRALRNSDTFMRDHCEHQPETIGEVYRLLREATLTLDLLVDVFDGH